MTAVSKNVYFDVLNNIVDKCNNTYHRTINPIPGRLFLTFLGWEGGSFLAHSRKITVKPALFIENP